MKNSYLITAIIGLLLITAAATAGPADKTDDLEHYIEKLDDINFLPGLLPVIIENSDIIELTDKQLEKLLTWRKANREQLIETRKEILQKHIEFKQAALSPDVSSARLIQMQNKIFRLQRAMLEYKLACRELVINTFNSKNWEGLFIVLADKDIGVTLPELYVTQR